MGANGSHQPRERLIPALVGLVVACDLAVMVIARFYWQEAFVPVVFGMAYASVAALLYMTNWVAASGQTLWILGHTWSLSIEEQFYLVWPLCLLALLRWVRHRGAILALLLLGIGASLLLKVAFVLAGAPLLRILFGLDTRFDELLIGCVVGVLASWGLLGGSRRPSGRLSAAVSVVAALILASRGLDRLRSGPPASRWHWPHILRPVPLALSPRVRLRRARRRRHATELSSRGAGHRTDVRDSWRLVPLDREAHAQDQTEVHAMKKVDWSYHRKG